MKSTNEYRKKDRPVLKRFGENLRTLRQRVPLTSSELAALCRLDVSAIDAFEKGEREPSYGSLIKLACCLSEEDDGGRTAMIALLDGIEWKPNKTSKGGRYVIT